MTKPTTTFRDAYATLQAHAKTLREQDEPNIDDLLSIVQESVAAYSVCRKRIDAVEKALNETLKTAGVEDESEGAGGETPGASKRAQAAGRADPGDDDSLEDTDIPF